MPNGNQDNGNGAETIDVGTVAGLFWVGRLRRMEGLHCWLPFSWADECGRSNRVGHHLFSHDETDLQTISLRVQVNNDLLIQGVRTAPIVT
jgi:hypothetical protein